MSKINGNFFQNFEVELLNLIKVLNSPLKNLISQLLSKIVDIGLIINPILHNFSLKT